MLIRLRLSKTKITSSRSDLYPPFRQNTTQNWRLKAWCPSIERLKPASTTLGLLNKIQRQTSHPHSEACKPSATSSLPLVPYPIVTSTVRTCFHSILRRWLPKTAPFLPFSRSPPPNPPIYQIPPTFPTTFLSDSNVPAHPATPTPRKLHCLIVEINFDEQVICLLLLLLLQHSLKTSIDIPRA